MNEQDLIKLKTDCELYKDRIVKVESRVEELDKRIIDLEKRNEKTDFQYEQIMKMLDRLNNVTIPKLTEEIQLIKNKPAERYNSIVTTIIGAVVGAIVGFIASNVLH